MTTAEVDRLAEDSIRSMGGIPTFIGYHGYAHTICASVNEEVVHGIPGSRVLKDGDLLSIDIGTTLNGYVSDSAVTVAIGNVSEAAQRLMRVTQECLMLGIAQMQAGNRLGDIGARRASHAENTATASSANWSATGSGPRCTRSPRFPTTGPPGTDAPAAGPGPGHRADDHRGHLRGRNPRRRLDGCHRRW